MKSNRKHIVLLSLAIILVGLSGCSRKKNGFTRRAYHNTTARYNGYFNAREIKKASVAKLYEQHKDDFSEIIPLFIYPSEEQSKAMYPDMDKIIEKTSTVIDRHSMYIKKEEYCRWIDDSYMLMGQARFYKQEYFTGEEIFEYLVKAFKKQDVKYEALMWLARTHIELGNMNKAESYLDLADKNGGVPKKYNSEFNAVYASFFIKKKNYTDAISRLTKALETTKKRDDKRRFNYVLAQLWLKKKEYAKASEHFTQVIKLKPRYAMMFNAKISRALSFDRGSEDSKSIKKMLSKMVKDGKNEEYLDQIYYALADIAFKEDNEPLGIDYLQRSAAASVSNDKQKALSYLRLGELFFDKPDFVKAQAYYDSCLTVLPETHERYEHIYVRSKALTNLVNNILIVQEEDSLQKLAGDEVYRDKVIAGLIKQAIEEEELKKLAIENEGNLDYNNNNKTNNNTNNNKGNWYFYNQTTLGFGYTDFKKNWGNRKLEDNWRRSNKESIASFEDDLLEKKDTNSNDSIIVNKKTTPEYYLQFIPLTEAKMGISHNKIIEALYALGNIYREDFQNYKYSTESFERLVERYDTSHYKLPSWYNLYRIALATDNDPMKAKYENLILDNFPESEYARIIQDPTYNKVTRETRKRVDNYYSIVFDLYNEEQYEKVLLRCENAKAIFADNHIQDRFDFLAALSIGHTNTLDSFKLALENIIVKHPKTEVSDEATRILALMKTGIKVETEPIAAIPYTHKFDDDFNFVMVVPTTDKQTNKYKIDISDFNTKYYSSKTFEVSNIFISPTAQIIIVKKVKGYEAAIDYYKSFKLNKDNLKEINDNKFQYFLISQENFVLFYKNKDIQGYQVFFEKNFEIKL